MNAADNIVLNRISLTPLSATPRFEESGNRIFNTTIYQQLSYSASQQQGVTMLRSEWDHVVILSAYAKKLAGKSDTLPADLNAARY